jgi:hypothetical protein
LRSVFLQHTSRWDLNGIFSHFWETNGTKKFPKWVNFWNFSLPLFSSIYELGILLGNKCNFPIWVLVEVCFSSTYLKMGFKWIFFPILGNKLDNISPKWVIFGKSYLQLFLNWEFKRIFLINVFPQFVVY